MTDIIFDIWRCNPRHLELTSLLLLSGERLLGLFLPTVNRVAKVMFSVMSVCIQSVHRGSLYRAPAQVPLCTGHWLPHSPISSNLFNLDHTVYPRPYPMSNSAKGKFPISAVWRNTLIIFSGDLAEGDWWRPHHEETEMGRGQNEESRLDNRLHPQIHQLACRRVTGWNPYTFFKKKNNI